MRKGQFILDGIIITKDKNIALLREEITRKVIRVELGQEINGMLIEKLDRDRITLKQGDEREELVLKIKTGPNPPGKPAGLSIPTQIATPATPPSNTANTVPTDNINDPRSIFELRRSIRQQPPE
jgi:type II secretory pathway component PulC